MKRIRPDRRARRGRRSPLRALAQGTLSTQGFGYPAGGMSTRALSMGGSVAELDPITHAQSGGAHHVGAVGALRAVRPRGPRRQGRRVAGELDRHPLPALRRRAHGDRPADLRLLLLEPARSHVGDAGERLLPYERHRLRRRTRRTSRAPARSPNVRGAAGWRLSSTLRLGAAVPFLHRPADASRSTRVFADTAASPPSSRRPS